MGVISSVKLLLSQREAKVMIVSLILGIIVQYSSRQCLKRYYPEVYEEHYGKRKKAKPEIEDKKPRARKFFPRGGAVIELSVIGKVLMLLGDNGILAILVSSWRGLIGNHLDKHAISKYLNDALPQNLADLEKKSLF